MTVITESDKASCNGVSAACWVSLSCVNWEVEALWSTIGSTATAWGVTSIFASDKGSEAFDFISEDADMFLDKGAVGGSIDLLLGVRDPSDAMGKG